MSWRKGGERKWWYHVSLSHFFTWFTCALWNWSNPDPLLSNDRLLPCNLCYGRSEKTQTMMSFSDITVTWYLMVSYSICLRILKTETPSHRENFNSIKCQNLILKSYGVRANPQWSPYGRPYAYQESLGPSGKAAFTTAWTFCRALIRSPLKNSSLMSKPANKPE